jgi:hypothetical protein
MGSTAENLHDGFRYISKARADACALGSQRQVAEVCGAGEIQARLDRVGIAEKGTGAWFC